MRDTQGSVSRRTGSMMWGFLALITSTFSCRMLVYFINSPQDPYEQGSEALHHTLPNHATASISSGPIAGGAIVLRVCSSRPECVLMLSLIFLQR